CDWSAVYCIVATCFFFFFSSRRRHTRLVSDWSSDVCSSDLYEWSLGDVTRHAAQACTGGLTSPRDHSYAGIWPLGCMYHSRRKKIGRASGRERGEGCVGGG